MNLRHIALAALATTAIMPIAAQSAPATNSALPRFVVLAPHGNIHPGVHHPQSLATWNGSISYASQTYTFTMVGTDPSSTNGTTTITAYIIPIRMTYAKDQYGKQYVFDPMTDEQNGVSIVQNVLNSPLFNNFDWKFGGTDVGNTQYLDAFQRGSFWSDVTANPNYHVVLSPVVLKEQTLRVRTYESGNVIPNPFGGRGEIDEMDLQYIDGYLQRFMAKFSQIDPSKLVIFVTDNIYLTSGGCCIGGYHTADGNGQTYMIATYAYSGGAFVFAQDISALSHEIGEWYDDPFLVSTSPCGPLDVAGPTGEFSHYGDFRVKSSGVAWHPQALAWMEYFGEPANFSANNWLDDKHLLTSVCQNGG